MIELKAPECSRMLVRDQVPFRCKHRLRTFSRVTIHHVSLQPCLIKDILDKVGNMGRQLKSGMADPLTASQQGVWRLFNDPTDLPNLKFYNERLTLSQP